jgi:hypothetical protein
MLAEVRPTGLSVSDTCRLAFPGELVAVRDGGEIRVAQGDGLGTQLLRAQPADDSALRVVVYKHHVLDDPRTEAVGCAVPAGQARVVDTLARHGFARMRRLSQADAQPLWMRTLREAFFSGRHV